MYDAFDQSRHGDISARINNKLEAERKKIVVEAKGAKGRRRSVTPIGGCSPREKKNFVKKDSPLRANRELYRPIPG